MIRLLVLLCVMLLSVSAAAQAHTRSQSQSLWTIEGDGVVLRVEADALDVTRLYALGGDASLTETFVAEVGRSMRLSANGAPCRARGAPEARASALGRIVATWSFDCPGGALGQGVVEVESRLFLVVAASHLHFAAVRDSEGRTAEAVLTEARPRVELRLRQFEGSARFWPSVMRFLPIGAQHVWSGLDHMAFILALTLACAGRWRRLLLAATGFTLGHSATLGLAALGVLRPDIGAVEALIGFTIAFVALEIGAGGEARMRDWSAPVAGLLCLGGFAAMVGAAPMSALVWFGLAAFVFAYPRGFPRGAVWLAAAFGLIHGCGFAGALGEMDLPQSQALAALLGFNLGVEAGQAAVIAGALLIGAIAQRAPAAARGNATMLAGAALLALGGYWFVSRLAGA